MRERHPSTVVGGLANLFEHERVHFSKTIASLMPILTMLTAADWGPLLSPDAADTRDPRRLTSMAECIERAQVVYLGLDALSESMVGSAIGSILVADLAAVAGDRYNYAVGLKPVNVFIDEAAEVVNDPFIQLLNKGRGAGLRLTVATQTFADFAARTGSEAKAREVLGNINNLVALRAAARRRPRPSAPGRVRHAAGPGARLARQPSAAGATGCRTRRARSPGGARLSGRVPDRGLGRLPCHPQGAHGGPGALRRLRGGPHRGPWRSPSGRPW